MAMEWRRPSTGRLVNGSISILTLYGTRNDVIGWGPHVADAFKNASDHWDTTIAFGLAAGFLAWAHWRRIARLFGLTEKPSPRWPDDKALKIDMLAMLQVPEHDVKEIAAPEADVSFRIQMTDPQKRAITFTKLLDGTLLVSARVAFQDGPAKDAVLSMDELQYRAMLGDVGIELVRAGVAFDAEWIVDGRNDPPKREPNEEPGVKFTRILAVNDALNKQLLIQHYVFVSRLILVTQVILGKYINEEQARRGEERTPLSVVPSAPIETSIEQ